MEKSNIMRAYRVRAGLSQEKAAELLGIARNTLCYYEQRPYSIPINVFVGMKEIYGDDFAEIYMEQKLYEK